MIPSLHTGVLSGGTIRDVSFVQHFRRFQTCWETLLDESPSGAEFGIQFFNTCLEISSSGAQMLSRPPFLPSRRSSWLKMLSLLLWLAEFCWRLRWLGRAVISSLLSAVHSFASWLADWSAPGVALSRETPLDFVDLIVILDVVLFAFVTLIFVSAFLCGRWTAGVTGRGRARLPDGRTTLAERAPLSPLPRRRPPRTLSPASHVLKSPTSLNTRPQRVLRRVAADPPSPGPGQGLIVPLCRAAPSAKGGSGLP